MSDVENRVIRYIFLASNVVQTFAGVHGSQGSADGVGALATFSSPRAFAADGSGSFYVADYTMVRRVGVAPTPVRARSAYRPLTSSSIAHSRRLWAGSPATMNGMVISHQDRFLAR